MPTQPRTRSPDVRAAELREAIETLPEWPMEKLVAFCNERLPAGEKVFSFRTLNLGRATAQELISYELAEVSALQMAERQEMVARKRARQGKPLEPTQEELDKAASDAIVAAVRRGKDQLSLPAGRQVSLCTRIRQVHLEHEGRLSHEEVYQLISTEREFPPEKYWFISWSKRYLQKTGKLPMAPRTFRAPMKHGRRLRQRFVIDD